MSFTEFRNQLLSELDFSKVSDSQHYQESLENELERIWFPVMLEFLSSTMQDAVNAYSSPVMLASANSQPRNSTGKFVADPYSFTQVMNRWRGAVRRLASVADLEPSEAFIEYTLAKSDVPSMAYAEVRQTLITANENGWTEYKLKRELSKQLIPKQGDEQVWKDDRSRYRNAVKSMARTTATRTASIDSLRAMSSQGYLYKKWVTRKDDRVRSTHRHIDGQRVPVNDSFTVGGVAMKYPGDPSAPLGLTINCRCFLVGVSSLSSKKSRKIKAQGNPAPSAKLSVKGQNMRKSLVASLTSVDAPLAIWSGIVGVEGKATGDNRLLDENSIQFDELPIPIRSTREDVGGHDTARNVGAIYSMWREPLQEHTGKSEDDNATALMAMGVFDLGSEEGREASRLVRDGFKSGVSMDLDSVTFEVHVKAQDDPVIESSESPKANEGEVDENGLAVVYNSADEVQLQVTKSARVRAVTLVDIPAFSDARIQILDITDDSVSIPDSSLEDGEDSEESDDSAESSDEPIEDIADSKDLDDSLKDSKPVEIDSEEEDDISEDALADLNNLDFSELIENLELSSIDNLESEDSSSQTFNWVDSVGGLPNYIKRIAKHLVAKGMNKSHAIASAVNTVKRWARGGGNVKADTRAKALKAIAEWEAKKARARANSSGSVPFSLTASASDIPSAPPEAWFNDPQLTEPTAIRVTEDGRVFGHVASWSGCHIGNPNSCTTPPHSATGYAYFHTGSVFSREGVEISVGRLVIGTGHADSSRGVAGATAHYDNTGYAVADVRAGEDAYGIWVSGALRPGISDDDIRVLRSSPLSGDWRRVNGNLEMVSALAVNVPGFPIPRPRAYNSHGNMQSLVASGMIAPELAHSDNSSDERFLRSQSEERARKLSLVRDFERKMKLESVEQMRKVLEV